MTDFTAARRMMVDSQVRPSDVTDLRLIDAMLALPREAFLPPQSAELAYLDRDLPIAAAGAQRCLLRSTLLARMIQALELTDADAVLDVGSLTGYSAALLGGLAGRVVALEEDPALVRMGQDNLKRHGVTNVACVHGPLVQGWSDTGPYDAIILEGATEIPPQVLLAQLKDGGRLIGVFGRGASAKAMLYRSFNGVATGRPIFDAAAPLLPGFAKLPAFVF